MHFFLKWHLGLRIVTALMKTIHDKNDGVVSCEGMEMAWMKRKGE